jgi:hypothetical protein
MLIFKEEGKLENPEKNPQTRKRINNKTQLAYMYDTESRN